MSEAPPKKEHKKTDIDNLMPRDSKLCFSVSKNGTTQNLGDWQRFGLIHLKCLVASIKCRRIANDKVVMFVTPIASGV